MNGKIAKKNYFSSMKIRDKLFYPYIAIILILVLSTSLTNWLFTTDTMKNELLNYSTALVKTISRSVYIQMGKISDELYSATVASGLVDLLYSDSNTGAYLSRSKYEMPPFINCFYNILYSKNYITGILYCNGGKDFCYYDKGLDHPVSGKVNSSNRFINYLNTYSEELKPIQKLDRNYTYWRQGADGRVCFIRPILHKETLRYLGHLLIELDARYLADVYYDMREKAGAIYVTNPEGDVLLGDFSQTEVLSYLKDHVATDDKQPVKIGKKEYYVQRHGQTGEGIGVVIFVSTDSLHRSFTLSAITSLVIAVILLLLAFFAGRGVFYSISYNIEQLLISIHKMSEGDFNYKIKRHSYDELSELAEQFNIMGEKISMLMRNLEAEQQQKMQNYYKMLESRYYALQVQINPHFLYNVLESINGLAVMNEEYEISEIISLLANLFRENVRRSEKFIRLKDELQYIRNYLTLYQKMYSSRVLIEFDEDEALSDYYIPTMVMLPVVENAIVHGIEKIEKKGFIKINTYKKNENLVIEVRDNGPGISKERIAEIFSGEVKRVFIDGHCSTGLSSLLERIKIMCGQEYGIEISKDQQGLCCVRLILPVIKGGEDSLEIEIQSCHN